LEITSPFPQLLMFGCKENGAALEATRFFVSFDVITET
jgi:hypothetical protein